MENIFPLSLTLIAQLVKNPPTMQETPVRFLGWEDPLEKGMAPHSSILTWRIHGLYSPQGCRVRCNFHFHFSCEKETSSAILSFSNACKLFESPIFRWFPVANHISLQFQYQFTYKNIFQIHQKKLNKKYVYPFLFLKADCNVLDIDTIL